MRKFFDISLGFSRKTNSILFLVAISFVLVAFVTITIYPFIATADGIKRIMIATGDAGVFNVLPPLQLILLGLSIDLTGGVGFYTFIQVLVLYLSVVVLYCVLLQKINFSYLFFAIVVTLAYPVTLIFPAILTDSALVFSCISIISFLIFKLPSIEIKFGFKFGGWLFYLSFFNNSIWDATELNCIGACNFNCDMVGCFKVFYSLHLWNVFFIILCFCYKYGIQGESKARSALNGMGNSWSSKCFGKTAYLPTIRRSIWIFVATPKLRFKDITQNTSIRFFGITPPPFQFNALFQSMEANLLKKSILM